MTNSNTTAHAHVSLITLGTADLARAATFYERLGFKRKMRAAKGVAFFEAGGIALSLYGLSDLARDAGLPGADQRPGAGGITLAWNCASEAMVDAAMAQAKAAGGRILVAAQKASWGGYHGHFADPDGHVWEVAFNPQFPLTPDGRPTLPD
ncbi:MAG: VOC family protein [Pseudorhodoplanes sp.]|nr:hypothetical protein [Pseudorhodoplanes sp.]MBW7947808.1 VOC family protein [Pseudorhodoplanes sp.]